MKKSKSRKEREVVKDAFDDGDDDVTITPYLSSAEIYRQFGAPRPERDEFESDASRASNRARNKGRSERAVASPENADLKKRSKRNKNVGSEPGSRGDSVGLRVIGGRFRGTKLEYGGDHRVRPMKDRVREAIFNLLGDRAKGTRVVDLFAGTGALTFEALSRGARSATMIEIHFPTARVARRNIDILDGKEPGVAKRIELVTTDVYFWAKKLAAFTPEALAALSPLERHSQPNLPTDLPWLVFCSPPYDFWIDRREETLELLRTLRERAPDGSIFVVEADDRFDFSLLDVEIPEKKRRSYPPAEVGIFYVDRSRETEVAPEE